MSPKRGLLLALCSLLAMLLAFSVVILVNLAGGELADFTGFPHAGEGRLAWDLGCFFFAGAGGAWTVTRLAPRAPRAHAAVFFVLTLFASLLGVVQLGSDWPRWFNAGILLSLPLQVGLGGWWALRDGNAVGRIEPG